jgi:BirA family transcriptional regulator, biotin operon repressor / biotin---[acetyl-CoA-carboxylase] ligase
MRHIHLDSCSSTQDYLKKLMEKEAQVVPTIVSTSNQTEGHGRRGNSWLFFENSLAFSFTLKPHDILTLSSLEIGILIIQFFESMGVKLKIKWPNDLMNEAGEKCGGIIQQFMHDQLVVGVGINLSRKGAPLPQTEIPIGSIEIKMDSSKRSQLPFEIVKFINSQRLKTEEIMNLFRDYHIYQDQMVTITDEGKLVTGKFIGLGEFGEALIQNSQEKIEKLLTGTLRLKAI